MAQPWQKERQNHMDCGLYPNYRMKYIRYVTKDLIAYFHAECRAAMSL